MGNTGLGGVYIADAGISYKMICLHLLDLAYRDVHDAHVVNSDWDENAISEVLANSINTNTETIQHHITAIVEKRMLSGDLYLAPTTVDDAPRIDIMIGGFGMDRNTEYREACYMEAKNLYSYDFTKTGHKSKISSTFYAKRYIATGIDNILKGHYPGDTLLLGYVLNGTIDSAVDKINVNLASDSRQSESIKMQIGEDFPNLVFGRSAHPTGVEIMHCYLLFI